MTCKLYWCKGTASLAPQIVLEEIGAPYDLIEIDTSAGGHRTPEYLALNPVGKVPTLVLPDGEIVTESAAICLFLAEHHKRTDLAPLHDDRDRAQFLRHLLYLSNTVQEAYKQYYYPHRYTSDPGGAPGIKSMAQDLLYRAWEPVETHLRAGGPFFLGDRSSILDVYLVMTASWFEPKQALFEACPAVQRCFARTASRPAVARCLEMQDELTIGAG